MADKHLNNTTSFDAFPLVSFDDGDGGSDDGDGGSDDDDGGSDGDGGGSGDDDGDGGSINRRFIFRWFSDESRFGGRVCVGKKIQLLLLILVVSLKIFFCKFTNLVVRLISTKKEK